MSRAIKVEKRCWDCPYLVTVPSDTNYCTLVKEKIGDIKIIAPFCPLPPWPSVTNKDITIASIIIGKINDYGYPYVSELRLKVFLKSIGVEVRDE